MKALFQLAGALALATPAPATSTVAVPQVVSRIALPDGGWDILTVDPQTHRVLIGRSDGVESVDTRTGAVWPRFVPGANFHSVTVVPGRHLAVASETAGIAVVFDPSTGQVKGTVKTDADADATIYEPRSRTVWVMNGDSGTITIVDPATTRAVGAVSVGGALEFPALDGRGHLFVNVEDRAELAEIDLASRKLIRRVPLTGCESPTGLAYLNAGVLLSACGNGVAKLTSARTLKPLGDIAIGPHPDGAFADAARNRAYIPSGGDGTLAVLDTSGALPRKIATVRTEVGARTGAVDPSTGTVYLPAAKYGPPVTGQKRRSVLPGTVELLVVH